jgi:putative nucleotidyltransferase with HDIG domain
MSLGYRAGQARRMLLARMDAADVQEALSHLPEHLRPLFLSMSVRDQRHALRVLRRLHLERGAAEPLLAQAALLHDVGKSASPLGIPGRSLVVLAAAAGATHILVRVPWLGSRVAAYLRHPAGGAEMLRAAGAEPALVEIVAEHQAEAPSRPETLRLQAVDGHE